MAVPRGRVGGPGPEARGPHPGGPGAGTGRDGATRPSGDGGMESEARCPVWEPQCGVSSGACAPGASSNGGRAPAAERWMGRQPPTPDNPEPRLPPSPDLDPLRYPPPSATWEGRELFNCQAPRFIIRSRAPEPEPSPRGNVWIPGSPISVIGPRVPSQSEVRAHGP
nr:PREDICTED: basic proline-rich protein-like [Bemisia tabaci]